MSTHPTSSEQALVDALAKMAAASKVANRIQINSVRIIEASFRQAIAEEDLPKQLDLTIKTAASLDRESATIAVNITCRLAANSKESERKSTPPVSIDAVFRLDYRLTSHEEFSQEEIDAFGDLNGVYNAWPYWREYVQSTLARMGLPAFTIPVFRPRTDPIPQSVTKKKQQAPRRKRV